MASLITGNSFDPSKDIPDLQGKVYVVTGGTAGIGFGISAHILEHGPSKLYLLGKKEEHGQEAQEELKKYGDTFKVEFIQCELENLKHTDEVAQKLAKLDRIDGLILNAGLGVGVYNETKADGIDSHMQVNIISQAHLLLVLLPILLKTPNSRVVFQSSENHRMAPSSIKFESVQELNNDIGPSFLYNRTKLAQILFNHALVARLKDGKLGANPDTFAKQGPWINCTHPGAVATDQPLQAEEAYGKLGEIGHSIIRPFMKDPVDGGSRSALFAATSEDVVAEKLQDVYIVPDRKVTSTTSQAQDKQLSENLWKLTMGILADKLGKQSYM